MNHVEQRTMRVLWAQVAVSLVVPLIAVFGVWLTIRADLAAQANAERAQTELQTAQVLAESGEVICGLSDELLVANVFEDFGPFCTEQAELPPSLPVQRELIQQLVEHPAQRDEILAMWRAVYEAEEWIDDIEAALSEAKG